MKQLKSEAIKRKRELLIRKKKKKELTKEERREKAIKEGKPFKYIVCPLCLRARIGRSWKGTVKFKIDPNPEIIQIRYGVGGRGCGGFFKKEDECVKLSELKEVNTEVYNNLKTEVKKLYNLFYKEV